MRVRRLFVMVSSLLGLCLLLQPDALCTISQNEPLPDLVVEFTCPSKAIAGEDIGEQIKLIARNIGKAPAPGSIGTLDPPNSYRIDLVISTDESMPLDFARYAENYAEDILLKGGRASRTIDLEPNTSQVYRIGGGIPADTPAGEYFICAQIDPGKKVEESNEKNNVSCRPIKIKVRG